MIEYKIISTGSLGNAVVLSDSVLVDCGIPYKLLMPYVAKLKLVLLTHIHSDHFNKLTIKRLSQERPGLRFGCCRWLVQPLTAAGVPVRQIDVFDIAMQYDYGFCKITPVMLKHNVPNCGYKLHFPNAKVLYATDTNSMNGITAPDYDLYLVEANYDDDEIKERIADKKANGEYPYELHVLQNHLSVKKCNDFLYANMGPNSVYVYMHGHVDRGIKEQEKNNE